ncbi:MAG: SHOCT domain-containing protein [Puniceicoccaceae bacterium]
MNPINPAHHKQRRLLRIFGPLILVVGLSFITVGMVSFFSAFAGGGMPKYFWCAFVGMPITFVGLLLCKFAFMGTIFRFSAGELAPVGKDTLNYMATETKKGVAQLSEAFHQGRTNAKQLSVVERIQTLESLRQSGAISQREFDTQKARILNEI